MTRDELNEVIAEIRRTATEQKISPEALLAELRQVTLEQGDAADSWLPEVEQALAADAPFQAESAPGIAQEALVRLLSTNRQLRRLFADLAHRSGVIPRIVLRLERAPSERQTYRAMGLMDRHDARVREAVKPWGFSASDPGENGRSNEELGRQIAAFLEAHGLPWPWLARATVGAFTWYVDDVATAIIHVGGDPYQPDREPADPAPTPAPLPFLPVWFWNESDRPTVPEDRVFTAIHLFRGDTIEKARARIGSYVDEVERYLQSIMQPAVRPGARPDKRRETIARNVAWFYRHHVQGETIGSIARADFASTEPNTRIRAAVVASRSKDVRDGIKAARTLLATRPFEQPILTLDEYEAGRTHL